MKKITIHTVNEEKLVNKVANALTYLYKYDIAVCITDDAYEVFAESNDRLDDILISLSISEDNYTYIYFWEDGVREMQLASCLNRHMLVIPNALSSEHFISKNSDAIFMKVELGQSVSPVDLAKSIYDFFED